MKSSISKTLTRHSWSLPTAKSLRPKRSPGHVYVDLDVNENLVSMTIEHANHLGDRLGQDVQNLLPFLSAGQRYVAPVKTVRKGF